MSGAGLVWPEIPEGLDPVAFWHERERAHPTDPEWLREHMAQLEQEQGVRLAAKFKREAAIERETTRDLATEDRRAVAMLAAEVVLAHLREGGTEDGAVAEALKAVYQAGADPDLCRRVAEFWRRKRASS